eukprot:SAG31_NODE_3287_length_4459_cov_117.198394_3_plen_175_part_00
MRLYLLQISHSRSVKLGTDPENSNPSGRYEELATRRAVRQLRRNSGVQVCASPQPALLGQIRSISTCTAEFSRQRAAAVEYRAATIRAALGDRYEVPLQRFAEAKDDAADLLPASRYHRICASQRQSTLTLHYLGTMTLRHFHFVFVGWPPGGAQPNAAILSLHTDPQLQFRSA